MTHPRRIADLNSDDKPREKALANGIRALSDAELLAILIGGGIPGKSAIDLAREILASCNGSLTHLSQMSIASMARRFKGMGPAKATTVAAALELGVRSGNHTGPVSHIRQSSDAYRFLLAKMKNLAHEEFWTIFLRRNNSIIITERISTGGSRATYVEPRMIVRKALDHNASAIIVSHNHPSGNVEPSPEDDNLTQRIKEASALMEIPLHDHIIVTVNGYYSYADQGRL